MRVKYIRVSTVEQNIDRQQDNTLKTYTDKCSGSIAFKDRKEASKLLSNHEVSEVLVHSIDRLGRNTIDIMNTIQDFTSRGINVVSVKEGLSTIVDGKENPIAKMMIGILGTLAEFELTRIKERQLEGISKAKAKGVYLGRSIGSKETLDVFMNKASTLSIIKYLKQGESISRCALLSKTSQGTVKKVKRMLKELA
jgi:DNA invertase Pin-like site-specific DNA recombinase|tara:strand:- start:43 stop:630 length:588 start_codon:yes stop_codon:yes gene_type:complete